MGRYTWQVGTGDWNDGANWGGTMPGTADVAAAGDGAVVQVSSSDFESVGGLEFSGSATLEINGGALYVGTGTQGNAVQNFILGSGGAILSGNYSTLTVTSYVNGTASGTVYLEGTGSTFTWDPQLSSYPTAATNADSSGLTVDFADNGAGATFSIGAVFNGTIQNFQAGDNIQWTDQDPNNNGTFTSTIGNDSVTLTDSDGHQLTINLGGASNDYNSSNVTVSASGAITTTFPGAGPQIGSSTYDAATGQLVVSAQSGASEAFTTNAGDFDPTALTITGEDGETYTLSGGTISNVSASSFTVTLTSADQLQVDGLLNQNGTQSTGNDIFNFGAGPTPYALQANANFDVGGRSSSGGITVSDALTPTLSSVSFDPTTGILTFNGSGFENAGTYGGVNLGQITLTGGDGQNPFTFNASDYASAVSSTEIQIDLSDTAASNAQTVMAGEEASVAALFDKAGTVSAEGTTYNVSATAGWDAGAGAAITTEGATVACFAAGTYIRTARGDVAVEALSVGDLVVTASGATRPVVWLGHRRIALTRHPRPEAVRPIRIAAQAFGAGAPRRDLFVSPDHALAFEGALIPAALLVNGASVEQVETESVEYWHVELDAHDVIFAEGLAAESYLDTGNRTMFANGGAFVEAYPDFHPRHWTETCLPMAFSGAPLARAKAALLARLGELGFAFTDDADAHMRVDGVRVEPIRLSPWRIGFALPEGGAEITLHSRLFVPAQTLADSDDARELGLCVARLQFDGVDWALDDDAACADGWHAAEGSSRWTRGPIRFFPGTRFVLVDFAGFGTYRIAPSPRAEVRAA